MDYTNLNLANVVIYARYSSDRQNEQSIDGQLDKCHEYAQQRGFRVVGEYCDRALSGRYAETRPEFQRMIADSAKHAFEYVLVWKLDRFSRDRYDSAIYKKKLRANGVRVLSVTEGIDESSESVLLEAILEAMAEEYSRQLAQNVKRGMRQNVEKGFSLGGPPILGYDVVDKKHQINAAEAQIIRFIYQAYVDGVPQKEIVAACKERGYKNKTGAEITLNSIKRFLQNRKYSGVHVLRTGEEIHGAYPPIVSAELDAAVRTKLAANAKAPGHAKAKAEYILHGKLFCGECGAPMIGECGRSRNGTFYYYYTCANKKKAHSCKKRNERKDELEEFIVDYIGSHILTDDWISDAADRVIAEYRKSYDASGIKLLEREIRDVNKNIESLVDALVKTSSEIALTKINERLEAAEAKKHILEDQLATLKIASRAVLKKEDIVSWLNQFRTGNSRDRDYQKKVIELFVNAIYIYDDKIKMFFNVTEESAQITYPEMLALEDRPSSDFGALGPPYASYPNTSILINGVLGIIVMR